MTLRRLANPDELAKTKAFCFSSQFAGGPPVPDRPAEICSPTPVGSNLPEADEILESKVQRGNNALRRSLDWTPLTGGMPTMETLRPVIASSQSQSSPVVIRCTDHSTAIRDETQLIESILAGDTSLYHDLVRPYEALVYRMAFVMLRNEADAEDAVQETFLRAYRKLASFRSESKFSTWLTSIVLNEARARLRRRKNGVAVSLDSLSSQTTPLPARYICDKQESALLSLERAELRSHLQRAIADLPAIYREVLQMRLVDECSVRCTAQALMSTEGVIKARLHRARRMLQRRFNANRTREKTFQACGDC